MFDCKLLDNLHDATARLKVYKSATVELSANDIEESKDIHEQNLLHGMS